jgi:DNA-binding CsgD family transcriptional regulator
LSDAPPPPIRIALEVDDPRLAERLSALLDGVPGITLVVRGAAADARVVAPPGEAAPPNGDVALTPREVEVLALLAEGASNKAIARRLGISVHTAKFHVGSLIDKLDAVGRTDVVAHAARLGVIRL